MRCLCRFTVVALMLAVAVGCGGGKVEPVARVKVSGKVKVDGKDVQSGTITFDAQNGQAPGAITILDGKYDGVAPVGNCKVLINAVEKMTQKEWDKKLGKPVVDGPGYDEIQERNLLPERYNTKSQITKDITEPGPHTIDFVDLKSK